MSSDLTHHRSSGWFMVLGVLIFLSAVEGTAAHWGLSALGWRPAAWTVTALHVYGVGWLLADALAMRFRPSRVEDGWIDVRVGLRWRVRIPRSEVLAVERDSGAAAEDLDLSVLGGPNLRLVLVRPVVVRGPFGLRRTADRLALQVDDPDRAQALLRPG